MVEETESVLKNEFKIAKAFGITTDNWQSGPQDCYESYTAHCIKETADVFEIHSRVLGTIPNNAKHTGQNLKKLLDKEMSKWELSDKYKTFVTDNASNILKCIAMSEEQGFGCFAHTINLCVNAGFNVPAIKKKD